MGCLSTSTFPKGHLQGNQNTHEEKKAFCIILMSSLCQHEDSDSSISVQAHWETTGLFWVAYLREQRLSCPWSHSKFGYLNFSASPDPWLKICTSLGLKELQRAQNTPFVNGAIVMITSESCKLSWLKVNSWKYKEKLIRYWIQSWSWVGIKLLFNQGWQSQQQPSWGWCEKTPISCLILNF